VISGAKKIILYVLYPFSTRKAIIYFIFCLTPDISGCKNNQKQAMELQTR
jgi:hypothetical protein